LRFASIVESPQSKVDFTNNINHGLNSPINQPSIKQNVSSSIYFKPSPNQFSKTPTNARTNSFSVKKQLSNQPDSNSMEKQMENGNINDKFSNMTTKNKNDFKSFFFDQTPNISNFLSYPRQTFIDFFN